jgi:DNA replication and repair protein RecF
MILKRLSLKNFRTYSEINLEFKARLIFFIGDNGEGKTNLLESISILSALKSFRGNTDIEICNWNESNYYIGAQLVEDSEEYKLEFGFESIPMRRKKIKLNGNIFKKQSDAFGFLPCIVLSPYDLNIIEGSHSERRRFIDTLLSYLDRNYLNELTEYNRLLKQRNASLKSNQINTELLLVWDKMLSEKDESIRNSRRQYINELNDLFQKNIRLLSGGKDEFILEYKPNVASIEEYNNKIRENFQKDLRVGYSTVGNHRDEIGIGYVGKDILEFGSQGQKRSSVISLKTASFELARRILKKDPVLLIDDVIRELDVRRRQFFVDLIRECGQAFFTTTDLEGIQDYIGNLSEPKQIFRIQSGIVQEVQS